MKMVAVNPATAEAIGEVPVTSVSAVPELYGRAKQAFQSWSGLPVEDRMDFFRRLREFIVDNLDHISSEISADTGKVHLESLSTEVLPVLEAIRHIEKHGPRSLRPQKVPTPILLIGKKSYIEWKPRGVVLVIAPWNFPFQLSMVPVLEALAAGNSVILKPSEVTPLVGTLMQSIFQQAGFPDHVIQVAHGGKHLGAALVDAKPDYIFFTGSVQTGQHIQQAAARHLIPTTLELGGKDPMIVFADAPLERAVQGALWGGFLNSGQVCMSVERLYVERPIYPQFIRRLIEEVGKLKRGFDREYDIGSMTFAKQVETVKEHVADAIVKGAHLRSGTSPDQWQTHDGLFIPPVVLTDVTRDMRVLQEETFGPILPVVPFDSEDEVVQLANDSIFGLGASVWCMDRNRAKRVASRLRSGNVLINDVVTSIVNQNLPYGGEKSSGLGRYHGQNGLRMFCIQTSVMVDKGRRVRELNWFPYRGKYDTFATLLRSYYGGTRRWIKFVAAYLQLLRITNRASKR